MRTHPELLIIAHRRNSRPSIEAAIQRGADGVEVDVRLQGRALVLAHDPITRDTDDLVRLAELCKSLPESIVVYVDFKEDAVAFAAEQIHSLGAFHRFVFFAEEREIVRSLAGTKRRFPELIANVSLRNVSVRETESWFDGLPDYVQIELWTRASIRAYLASRTRLAFDAMLNVDLFPATAPLVEPWVSRVLRATAMIQTDHPERWTANGDAPQTSHQPTLMRTPFGPWRTTA